MEFSDFARKVADTVTNRTKSPPKLTGKSFRQVQKQFEEQQLKDRNILSRLMKKERDTYLERLDEMIRGMAAQQSPHKKSNRFSANEQYLREILAPNILELKLAMASKQEVLKLMNRVLQVKEAQKTNQGAS